MDAYIQARQQQQRGRMMRYNSVDNSLLGSPYDPRTCMYVHPSHYQQSHSHNMVVQLQPCQLPLLPLPTTNSHQYLSFPLRASSGKLNHLTRNKLKSNHQKKEKQKVSKNMIGLGDTTAVAKEKLDYCEEIRRISISESEMAFGQAPHPSRLPLPKFLLKQKASKLGCKAEANVAFENSLSRVLKLP